MYYPKSQIKSNLYTNGGEYINSSTNELYKGSYYEISNGNKYTGKTPEDGPNILLIVSNISNENISPPEEITLITNFKYQPNLEITSRSLPSPSLTLPTPQEQQLGAFTRYFSKKNNELKYMEINKDLRIFVLIFLKKKGDLFINNIFKIL